MAKRVQPIRQVVNRGDAIRVGIPGIIQDEEFRQAFKDHYKSLLTSEVIIEDFDLIIEYIIERQGPISYINGTPISRWAYEMFLLLLTHYGDKVKRRAAE